MDLRGAGVVITGASSGIGRAAALAFARRGAQVALVARGKAHLAEALDACRREGGHVMALQADVGDAAAMRDVAARVAEAFGRLDVWVNNAGVGAVGAFTETPAEAHDQVIRTNLVGYLHGAHAALPHFLRQGRGTLINNLSFGAWVPAPFAAAYSASKFGLRGLSDSLRAELAGQRRIRVCDVFPSFIDTPGVQHGANYTGRRLKPAPPVYAPQRVAEAMVRLARRPRRTTTVGAVATLARLGYAVAPMLMRPVMTAFMRAYLAQAPRVPRTDGNLFAPMEDGRGATGGWRSTTERALAYGAAAGAAGLILLVATRAAARH